MPPMFEADNFATREHRIQDPHSLIYIHYSHYISSMCGRVCLFFDMTSGLGYVKRQEPQMLVLLPMIQIWGITGI